MNDIKNNCYLVNFHSFEHRHIPISVWKNAAKTRKFYMGTISHKSNWTFQHYFLFNWCAFFPVKYQQLWFFVVRKGNKIFIEIKDTLHFQKISFLFKNSYEFILRLFDDWLYWFSDVVGWTYWSLWLFSFKKVNIFKNIW